MPNPLSGDTVDFSTVNILANTTLTLGAPSAAAACARLLRLDAQQCRNAISAATSLSGGFKRQFGTNAKPFHAGLGAKNGILAAQMARATS